MRQLVASIALLLLLAASAGGAPSPARCSCAGTASLNDVAKAPATAVFTGWATGQVAGSQDLVFVVDRWFHGRHAAKEVRLVGSSAVLAGPEAHWPVETALAEVVAGDAISLTPGEPVLMVADWVAAERAFVVRFCTVAGLPLASAEGKAALAEAMSAFGAGRSGTALPDTGALPARPVDGAAAATALPDWSLPVLALALASTIVLLMRRLAARRPLRPS